MLRSHFHFVQLLMALRVVSFVLIKYEMDITMILMSMVKITCVLRLVWCGVRISTYYWFQIWNFLLNGMNCFVSCFSVYSILHHCFIWIWLFYVKWIVVHVVYLIAFIIYFEDELVCSNNFCWLYWSC